MELERRSSHKLIRTTLPLGAAVLLAAGLQAPAASAQEGSQDSARASAIEQLDDADVRRAIESELMVDSAVPFDALDVSVDRGIVRLSGTVDNILASERAVELARSVRGVLSVVSTIVVAAPRVEDDELAANVDRALLLDPACESYEIEVSAADGVVTLEGQVQSWAERELARKVAKGVRGVERLDDRMTVEWGVDREDVEIAAEIRERLRWDAHVDDGLIDVRVEGGMVTLEGSVGSAAERERARRKSYVAGVTMVDVSDLEVRPELRDEMTAYGKHDVDDTQIATALERAWLYDPRVLSFRPEVDVEDGVVTLTGVVSSPLAREAAEDDALATVGVWRVRNLLKVRPSPSQRTDAALEDAVEQRILWDPYVDPDRVDVTVSDDVAYLSGEAYSLFERERAADVAEGVSGVVEVRNLLRLEARPEVKPDWEIREQIHDELFWSPFVDADQVQVRVHDGRATLTGDVDSFAERRAATENAFEGGAVEVDNRLGVLGNPDWIF